jgi:hypothetical protein
MEPRMKVYAVLSKMLERYHFAPLTEGPTGKKIHRNPVLMTLSYLLDLNHLLVGEPGWGKTTGAKILCAMYSDLPYDLYDALEIRGNPQKYEEKIVGRYDYGALSRDGIEKIIWQGTFGLDALMIDEGNRLPLESQDVCLQGIETNRWNYMNQSLYEGKKPTFVTMNERVGHHQNGFDPAFKDRLDIVTENSFWRTMMSGEFTEAKARVLAELHDLEYTNKALEALQQGYDEFKGVLGERPLVGSRLTPEDKMAILMEMKKLGFDNDAELFKQAFMAEINRSEKYGCKRSSDPISDDTHDLNHAGVNVWRSFSPRSDMAVEQYAKALAWFLQDPKVTLDHVKFVLPHIFAHKANFTDDYQNKHGNESRRDAQNPNGSCQMLFLARKLVGEVHDRYVKDIQPMKTLIAIIQKWTSGRRDQIQAKDDASKALVRDLKKIEAGEIKPEEAPSLSETKHDHPLMKDFIRELREGDEKAFYQQG